jgi:NADP-reducing hydrogenase subunit HndB
MTSYSELKELRERVRKQAAEPVSGKRIKITVGMGSCGLAAGARETFAALLRAIERERVENVVLFPTGCHGNCDQEPIVTVEVGTQRVIYGHVDAEAAERIVVDHLLRGRLVPQNLLYVEEEEAVAA